MTGSKWTLDSLHEFCQQRFTDLEKASSAAMSSAERAVNKAEDDTTKRLDAMNEIRSAMSDQSKMFLARTEFDAYLRGIETRLIKLESYQSEQIGMLRQTDDAKQRSAWVIGVLVTGIIGVGAWIISWLKFR